MTTRIVTTDQERESLHRFIDARDLPITVNITKGKDRSGDQNRLAFKWYGEIAQQLDDQSIDEWRAYCKLTIGVPILRAENEDFRGVYDRMFKHLSYPDKLELIRVMDIPITRLMDTKQMVDYLDTMQRHFGEQGVILTNPKDQGT